MSDLIKLSQTRPLKILIATLHSLVQDLLDPNRVRFYP